MILPWFKLRPHQERSDVEGWQGVAEYETRWSHISNSDAESTAPPPALVLMLALGVRNACRSNRAAQWCRRSSATVNPQRDMFVPQGRSPWNFPISTWQPRSFNPVVERRKEELYKLANEGQITPLLQRLTQLKQDSDFQVDLDIYNCLVLACSVVGLPNEARAFIADMHLMGIKPDIRTFVLLLRVSERPNSCRHY